MKNKEKVRSLFSQAYSVKGDGVAVLKSKRLKTVQQFRKSLEIMNQISVEPDQTEERVVTES
ncbi:hypothetical protein [Alcanivorax sp.]|uniref:hypothetical protein n=1 Tax=Alcanivorax sp. TaxID=1872427 RepID=UPI0025C3BB88|nr:hypothetical protein [Alcanivorax sp.]